MTTTFIMPETHPEAIGPTTVDIVRLRDYVLKLARPKEPGRLLDLETVAQAYDKDEYRPYWAALWPVAKWLGRDILSMTWPKGTRALFFFSSRRRHTIWNCDWSSDVCSSDLHGPADEQRRRGRRERHQGRPQVGHRRQGRKGHEQLQYHRGAQQLPRSYHHHHQLLRSEERRVGKECRSPWSTEHQEKKIY